MYILAFCMTGHCPTSREEFGVHLRVQCGLCSFASQLAVIVQHDLESYVQIWAQQPLSISIMHATRLAHLERRHEIGLSVILNLDVRHRILFHNPRHILQNTTLEHTDSKSGWRGSSQIEQLPKQQNESHVYDPDARSVQREKLVHEQYFHISLVAKPTRSKNLLWWRSIPHCETESVSLAAALDPQD
jgi:hypothetical protein